MMNYYFTNSFNTCNVLFQVAFLLFQVIEILLNGNTVHLIALLSILPSVTLQCLVFGISLSYNRINELLNIFKNTVLWFFTYMYLDTSSVHR